MRIEQLEYLTAVAEHGSLRRASEGVHVSQPALSEAIGKLEKELGVSLLDRRRTGSRMNEVGSQLLPAMTEVLDAVRRLRAEAEDHSSDSAGGRGVIRVGTVNTATSSVLLPGLRNFGAAHPGITVEVVHLPQAQIDEHLAEGSLDLGLVNVLEGDTAPPRLESIAVLHDGPAAVLPADHPLTAQASVTVDELRSTRFITMRSGFLMHRFAHRLFGADFPQTGHSTDGAEMAKLMVAEGVGVTVLPRYSVAGDPLVRSGLVEHRPISDDDTLITLQLRRRPGPRQRSVQELCNRLIAECSRHRAAGRAADGTADRTADRPAPRS